MPGQDGKRILLVEDEAIIALSEKAALERYGYRVTVAGSASAAMERFEATDDLDLVLMDMDLGPGPDGTQVAERMLGTRELPVIFLSSHIEPGTVGKTERISSYGYVTKNSSITVLDASIKMAFRLFEARRGLKAANDRLEALFDAMPDLLFEVDLDGRYHGIHSSRMNLLYRPAAELMGKTVAEVLPGPVAETVMAAIAEAGESGMSQGRHYQLDVPSGARWFEITVSRIAGDPGQPRFILLCRDVSGYRAAEDAARQSRELLERYLDVAAQIVISHDPDGNITLLNDSGHRILGYEPPELVGRNWFDACLPAELREETRRYFERMKESEVGSIKNRVNDVITKSGVRKTILWHNTVFRDDGGRFTGLFSSGEDITELRRAEENVKALLAEKELILREVHHRIKNNMASMISLLTLQAGNMEDPAAAAALESAASRMEGMVLMYDRLYRSDDFSGLSLRDYLPALVEGIVATHPSGIPVAAETVAEDIVLDAARLQPLGILVNELLTNALKYAFAGRERGRISVSARLRDGLIGITVRDDGVGMPEGMDAAASSGFGLMLTRALAAQLDGTIRIERTGGTSVTLEFPAKGRDEEPPATGR